MITVTHESRRTLHIYFWFCGWWGRGFFPHEDLPGWQLVRIRPRWYWKIIALKEWLSFIWLLGGRPILAWQVCGAANGVSL